VADMIEPFFALANITSPVLIETVSFALAFGTITTFHIVLGELAPKSIAIRKALPTTLWVSTPLRFFISLSSRQFGSSMGSLIVCSNAFSTSILSPKASWPTARKNCG